MAGKKTSTFDEMFECLSSDPKGFCNNSNRLKKSDVKFVLLQSYVNYDLITPLRVVPKWFYTKTFSFVKGFHAVSFYKGPKNSLKTSRKDYHVASKH